MSDVLDRLAAGHALNLAEQRLQELGPWDDRSAIAGLGPMGLSAAWVGKSYAVQRYTVLSRPGWDRLTVTRHDGRHNSPRWADWQAIKLLLPHGADRLGFEVSPPVALTVDLAPAWHLWVLPMGDPLAALLDLGPELSDPRPTGVHDRILEELRQRKARNLDVEAIILGRGLVADEGPPITLWGLPVRIDPSLKPGEWRLEEPTK